MSCVVCREQVVRLLPGISPQGYYALLHRPLHLDAAASYADQEMGGEVERVEKCLSAIPVREDTITLITLIHLTGRPLFNSDVLDAIKHHQRAPPAASSLPPPSFPSAGTAHPFCFTT